MKTIDITFQIKIKICTLVCLDRLDNRRSLPVQADKRAGQHIKGVISNTVPCVSERYCANDQREDLKENPPQTKSQRDQYLLVPLATAQLGEHFELRKFVVDLASVRGMAGWK
jgi:hypothetical protein